MNDTVLIGGREISARTRHRWADPQWDGRESWELTMELECEDAKGLFVNDAQWSLRRSGDGVEEHEVDMSDFSVAGQVSDNRDGTVTVRMGVLTEREALKIILGETV